MAHEPLLSSTEAASVLDVAPATVKRWADSGLLPCVRTAGGHRRFRRADLEAFRARVAASAPAGWVDFLVQPDLDPYAVHSRLLAERALQGSWVRTAEALGPVLVELGERWADGRITVLHEHLASERLSRGLARCAEAMPTRDGARQALLATPESEEHTLGLSLAELILREAGWDTRWSGRRTPVAEIARWLAEGGAQIAVLSASEAADALELKRIARTLAGAARRAEGQVLLGGLGAWPREEEPGATRVESFDALARWLAQHGSV